MPDQELRTMKLQRDEALRELALVRQVLQIVDDGLGAEGNAAQPRLASVIASLLQGEGIASAPRSDEMVGQILMWGRLWLRTENPSLSIFDEDYYRSMNEDIDAALKNGRIKSGFRHWLTHGAAEGRAYRFRSSRNVAELCSANDTLARRNRASVVGRIRAALNI